MHLQQTKRESRESGGPQYYFHDLTDAVKTYLRQKGAVRVALLTPYGATKTDYSAVGKEHKYDANGKVVGGKVGHDRIQQGKAAASIGESIRNWYNLPKGDFERIDVEIDIVEDAFYLTPIKCKLVNSKRLTNLNHHDHPLAFNNDYISRFWKDQIKSLIKRNQKYLLEWSQEEICRIVAAHNHKVPHLQEPDILRASGPLKHLGLSLGPYVGKGFDCLSEFKFLEYPLYTVPVEIKRFSKDYKYQMQKYGKDELSRAVILCITHDLKQVPRNVDVIELDSMCRSATHL